MQIYLILIYGKLVLFIRINNKKIKIINKIFYFLKGKNLNFINNKKIGFLFMFLMINKKNKSIKWVKKNKIILKNIKKNNIKI